MDRARRAPFWISCRCRPRLRKDNRFSIQGNFSNDLWVNVWSNERAILWPFSSRRTVWVVSFDGLSEMSLPLENFNPNFSFEGNHEYLGKWHYRLPPFSCCIIFILISSSAFFENGTRDDAHNDLSIGKRSLNWYRAFVNNIELKKDNGKNDRKRRLRAMAMTDIAQGLKVRG